MPCPFAKFATVVGEVDPMYAQYHNYHSNSQNDASSSSSSSAPLLKERQTTSTPPLSEYLKTATAKAHREVESSQGVRTLMGFGPQEDGAFVFGRLDYVRWMIMLGCIYAALESAILAQDAAMPSMLSPLLQARAGSSSSLMSHLLRFPSIMQDIETHLRVLAQSTGNEEGAGLTWDEVIEDVRDSRDEGASTSYAELKQLMASIPQEKLMAETASSLRSLTAEYIDLLTPTEAHAALVYTARLLSLSTFTQPGIGSDLLLSQAYVRYLGDLSGGQHIRRRIEKLFPVSNALTSSNADSDAGFAFYAFRKPASVTGSGSSWHHTLKDTFRTAMDSAVDTVVANDSSASSQWLLDLQGQEASLAFELNKDLFEGIIGNAPTTVIQALPSKPSVAVALAPAPGCPVTATLQFLSAIATLACPAQRKRSSSTATSPLLHGLPLYSHVLPVTFLGLAVLVGGTSIALHAL